MPLSTKWGKLEFPLFGLNSHYNSLSHQVYQYLLLGGSVAQPLAECSSPSAPMVESVVRDLSPKCYTLNQRRSSMVETGIGRWHFHVLHQPELYGTSTSDIPEVDI